MEKPHKGTTPWNTGCSAKVDLNKFSNPQPLMKSDTLNFFFFGFTVGSDTQNLGGVDLVEQPVQEGF